MKAEFVRRESDTFGDYQVFSYHFKTMRGKKNLHFSISSYGPGEGKEDMFYISFGVRKRCWPEGAESVTIEIFLPGHSIRKTLADRKYDIRILGLMPRLPEKDEQPCFEVKLTFDPR